MDPHLLKHLLKKYNKGICTAAETKLVEDWLATIHTAGDELLEGNFLDEQLRVNKAVIDGRISPTTMQRKHWGWIPVAASLFLAAGLSAIVWANYFRSQNLVPLPANNQITRSVSNGWVVIQTPKGKNDNIKLADGSLITLAPSSRLRYPLKFSAHKRPVFLDEGEALFNVAKDKTSPFTVYTSKFATTALGTAFNIRSYSSEHKVSISLIHGKIRVDDLHPSSAIAKTKILLPHQQMVLDKLSGKLQQSDFTDEAPITAWKDGVLSFKDATMDEVVNSIENHYAVTVVNNSKRINWSYTGDFNGETLADVMNTVCLTEGLTCSINRNIVTLH